MELNHKWIKDIQEKYGMSNESVEKAVNDELRGKAPLNLPPPPNWQNTDSVMVKAHGRWDFHSYKDPRWCKHGVDEVGGIGFCPKAKLAYEDMKKAFGDSPYDLIYRFEPMDLKKFKIAIDKKMNKKI